MTENLILLDLPSARENNYKHQLPRQFPATVKKLSSIPQGILPMASISSFDRNGFFKYATQPASNASCRVISLSMAVIIMTGNSLPDAINCRCRSMPEIPPR